MDFVTLIFTYIVPFVLVLGAVVFFHELGHFLLAKAVGIRVEVFSLGFPPRLFGKKIGDTDYCISAIPVGGYVRMAGMVDESLNNEISGEPWEFMSKSIWQRALVIFAGPGFNVLLAILIFSISTFITGVAEPVGPIVGGVLPDSPAEHAGLVEGDVIYSVDEQPVNAWEDLVNIIHHSADQPLPIEWRRGDELMSHTITPKLDSLQNIGLIGISPKIIMREAGVFESISSGSVFAWNLTKMVGSSFGLLFSGKVSVKEGLAGPVRIAQMTGETAKTGFINLLVFTAFLSLNLGLLNLLPIPVLDGGHLVFLGIEAVIRRPISIKFKMAVQQIGMVLLLALMVFVIANDIFQVLR